MENEVQFLLRSLAKVTVVSLVLLTIVAYTVYVERKVCAFIQDRIGPNRTGPWGLLQPVADAIKAFLKEEFTPAHVRKGYFWLAPAIVMIPSMVTVAVIPFGSVLGSEPMVLADLNIGILFSFAVVSLGVYGIVLAGYAANSKYPFMGGIRSSAQVISYEVAMGLSVVPVFLLVGSLNLGEVVAAQSGGLFHWMIFRQPLAFLIFLAAAFAETNRLPFDLPEAEQELAGGYNVEYGSIRFAMFFLAEYANMVAVSALIVTLFLGGWSLPWWGLDQPAGTWWQGVMHIGVFLAKMFAVLLVFIWTRWMLPRFRYDQLMHLGWKRAVPLALANVFLTALVLWFQAL
ncbi:MAG: NADH-quinone oxidoreductase subunit NuoH [Verrucomicrobia bacterium]|nr:MAG: NADH-quinone oxidoreductase subunit NuoH [Verrucomicrobiota bacterium]